MENCFCKKTGRGDEMRLIQETDYFGNETIRPENDGDRPIFRHCSDGAEVVYSEYFYDYLALILTVHGVEYKIKIEDIFRENEGSINSNDS